MTYAKHVVVVGAGIVGASCAYYLTQAGLKVTVFEAKQAPATQATARSAAGLRHQFSDAENIKMSQYSAQAYSNFADTFGVSAGYQKVGYLFLLTPSQWETWQPQLVLQQSLGVRVEALSVEDVKQRFPDINTNGLAGATLGLDDGIIDPPTIAKAYLHAATEQGAIIYYNHPIERIISMRGQWRVKADEKVVSADAIVNAAGGHAQGVAALAGIEIPVLPYRRNIYVTNPLANFPHPYPLTIDMNTALWLRSEGDRFYIGRSNEAEPAGFNEAVDWDWLQQSLTLALQRFPFLGNITLDLPKCWAGLYATTPDDMPILGEVVDHPGFLNACGFSGHGVQHAPATGLLIKEILCEESPTFDLTNYRLERFLHTLHTPAQSETNIV